MYRPDCIFRLRRVLQGIEFKKMRTFPQPTIMDIQEQLKPTIVELQTALTREIEIMMKCINEDYSIKEQELQKIDDNEINNFVDGYEYRTKQLLEMIGFLIGAFQKACNNEKEMLEQLENDSKLADIVKYIKECEEEDIELKEKEEMMKSKFNDETNKTKEDEKENKDVDNKNEKDKGENGNEENKTKEDEKDKKEDENKTETEDIKENEGETAAKEDENKKD